MTADPSDVVEKLKLDITPAYEKEGYMARYGQLHPRGLKASSLEIYPALYTTPIKGISSNMRVIRIRLRVCGHETEALTSLPHIFSVFPIKP